MTHDNDVFDRLLDKARKEPIKYVKHDVDAHYDDALLDLCMANGIAAYGMYWLLVENLTARETHFYSLQNEAGKFAFHRDMSAFGEVPIGDCMAFVEQLAERGLIDTELWEEKKTIIINRVCVDAENVAMELAKKMFGAYQTQNIRRVKKA